MVPELVCCLDEFRFVKSIPAECDFIFAKGSRSFWFDRSTSSVEIWDGTELLTACPAHCPDGKVVTVWCANPVELAPAHLLVMVQVAVDSQLPHGVVFDYLGRLNTDSGQLIASIQLCRLTSTAISPDGRWVAWNDGILSGSFGGRIIRRRRFDPERMRWIGEDQSQDIPDFKSKFDVDDTGMVWGHNFPGIWLWSPDIGFRQLLPEQRHVSMVPLFRACGNNDVYLRTSNCHREDFQQEIVRWKVQTSTPCGGTRTMLDPRGFSLVDECFEETAFAIGALCNLTIESFLQGDWLYSFCRMPDRLCVWTARNKFYQTKVIRETDSLRNRSIATLVRTETQVVALPDEECRRIAEGFVLSFQRIVLCTC